MKVQKFYTLSHWTYSFFAFHQDSTQSKRVTKIRNEIVLHGTQIEMINSDFLLGVLSNPRQESKKQEIISLLIGDNDDYGEGIDDAEEDVDGNIYC